jgi:hypothetical protein
MPPPPRDSVFISHSHKDSEWLDRLKPLLEPLIHEEQITVWNDTMLQASQQCDRQIREALARAKVAVLLVSADFLASRLIVEQELPWIMEAAESGEVRVVWIPVGACAYETSPIARYHAASDPSRPLSTLSVADRDRVLAEISQRITAVAAETPRPVVAGWPSQSWIQRVAGSFKDQPEFDEVLRLGREFRQTQRPDYAS